MKHKDDQVRSYLVDVQGYSFNEVETMPLIDLLSEVDDHDALCAWCDVPTGYFYEGLVGIAPPTDTIRDKFKDIFQANGVEYEQACYLCDDLGLDNECADIVTDLTPQAILAAGVRFVQIVNARRARKERAK